MKFSSITGAGVAALVLFLAAMLSAQAPTTQGSQAPAGNQSAQQQPQGQEPSSDNNGVYVFRKQVEEVQLHATVLDDKHRMVTDLARQDFAVYENGQPQKITSFDRRDIPVSIGIVIDNSGSMRDKRPAVNQAALNLVRASNPNDEVFIVNFNDEYYLDQDFTANLTQLKEGLEKIDSRGGTALYDAIVASADHLDKNAKLDKKVLLVVTDGEDNASRESLEQAIRKLQKENGPTVYAIGLLGEERQKRARRALSALAENTGGISYFPRDLHEVDTISTEVAHDIRNQYIIGYKPSNGKQETGYRTVRVEAKAPGHGKLMVRTRTGYYSGQERAAANSGN
jgi:Ca-activated chloride channel family protein